MSDLLLRQFTFTENLAKLIQFINETGLKCKVTEVFRTAEQAEIYAKKGVGIKNSQHCSNLAADIYLFEASTEGKYKLQSEFKQYEFAGKYWESLHKDNKWGGYFKRVDCVHFEMRG